MDSNSKIWKFISKQLNIAQNSTVETIYQKTIADIFTDSDFLGWPKEQVIREYGIKMGSTKKCDIVLLDSERIPFIAIEVKLANSPSNGVEQLGSYMDRCTPRLKYGITIKDSINIFYDEETGHSLHSENDAIFSTSFDLSDSNGEKFVELFKYSNFNFNVFKDFCESRLIEKRQDEVRERKINKIRNILSGGKGNETIKTALCHYLIANGIIEIGEESILDEVIDEFPLTLNSSIPIQDNQYSTQKSNSQNSVPEIIYVPSKEKFVEYLRKQTCYRHFILKDSHPEMEEWKSGGLDINNLNGNIRSTSFYKKNKNNIVKIIISPYSDINRRD